MDVQAEIRTWLLKQNDWLQEAADRLLKNGELGATDIAALVARHRRSITTDNRLHAVQDIEPKDCELIDTLMTKYSCYEHSQSSEIPVFIPEEPELRQDLEALKAWRDGLNKRRAEAA
ncbi:hypothetical protein [Pseudomonas yangonensis]|uniref:hypothetical protein n=1 Tax=Pseudomonas yangonensis TaxID=2579922 RepID=UPI0015B72719|nr:hypothetical protein [Pseudomonas yangonensis]